MLICPIEARADEHMLIGTCRQRSTSPITAEQLLKRSLYWMQVVQAEHGKLYRLEQHRRGADGQIAFTPFLFAIQPIVGQLWRTTGAYY